MTCMSHASIIYLNAVYKDRFMRLYLNIYIDLDLHGLCDQLINLYKEGFPGSMYVERPRKTVS